MKPIIQLEHVWKRYNMAKAGWLIVLRGVNVEINLGDFVAITGPSGSGKSTVMHLIGALDTPSSGRVLLKGTDIHKIGEAALAELRSKTIGFVFQQFNLIATFTALENVMLPMELIDVPESDAKNRATELLGMIGLGNRINHKPTELSGGQQQRVAIARALANDPELILADEPTGNLDTKTGLFVMNFLEALNRKGKTIILVTHEVELLKYASRIIYMRDGVIEKEVFNKKQKKEE